MFTSVSHYEAFQPAPHLIVFSPGRKDDEMDPMDPSAYSDAPRYSIISSSLTDPAGRGEASSCTQTDLC